MFENMGKLRANINNLETETITMLKQILLAESYYKTDRGQEILVNLIMDSSFNIPAEKKSTYETFQNYLSHRNSRIKQSLRSDICFFILELSESGKGMLPYLQAAVRGLMPYKPDFGRELLSGAYFHLTLSQQRVLGLIISDLNMTHSSKLISKDIDNFNTLGQSELVGILVNSTIYELSIYVPYLSKSWFTTGYLNFLFSNLKGKKLPLIIISLEYPDYKIDNIAPELWLLQIVQDIPNIIQINFTNRIEENSIAAKLSRTSYVYSADAVQNKKILSCLDNNRSLAVGALTERLTELRVNLHMALEKDNLQEINKNWDDFLQTVFNYTDFLKKFPSVNATLYCEQLHRLHLSARFSLFEFSYTIERKENRKKAFMTALRYLIDEESKIQICLEDQKAFDSKLLDVFNVSILLGNKTSLEFPARITLLRYVVMQHYSIEYKIKFLRYTIKMYYYHILL